MIFEMDPSSTMTIFLWCAPAQLIPLSVTVLSFYVTKMETLMKNAGDVNYSKHNIKEEKGYSPSRLVDRKACKVDLHYLKGGEKIFKCQRKLSRSYVYYSVYLLKKEQHDLQFQQLLKHK